MLFISLLIATAAAAAAQPVTVSVGGVPKYSGILVDQKEVRNLKDINQFLNVLESQLAAEFVKYSDVDYLDRTNTLEVFRELHISSSPSFDPSSGAIRGLMGRLDFLAVLDSSEPSTARIRLIDVETGAVKAIETCKKRTSFLGLSSDTPPDCISLFVAKARSVASAKLAVKRGRLQKSEQEKQEAQKKLEVQRRKDAQLAKAEENRRQQEKEAAQHLAEQQAQAQMQLDAQIAGIKPSLDDAMARLSAESDFWRDLERELIDSGHSLRPSIRTALNGAVSNGHRCQDLLAQQNADGLQKCIADLNRKLDALDALK
jgi:hypothetical protein